MEHPGMICQFQSPWFSLAAVEERVRKSLLVEDAWPADVYHLQKRIMLNQYHHFFSTSACSVTIKLTSSGYHFLVLCYILHRPCERHRLLAGTDSAAASSPVTSESRISIVPSDAGRRIDSNKDRSDMPLDNGGLDVCFLFHLFPCYFWRKQMGAAFASELLPPLTHMYERWRETVENHCNLTTLRGSIPTLAILSMAEYTRAYDCHGT